MGPNTSGSCARSFHVPAEVDGQWHCLLSVPTAGGRGPLPRQRGVHGLDTAGGVLSCFPVGCVEKASALFQSVRRTTFQTADLLSVDGAWTSMDNGSYTGRTLDVVFALREAHNSVLHTVLWPTPR